MSKINKPFQAGMDKNKLILIVSNESNFEKGKEAFAKLKGEGYQKRCVLLRPDNSELGAIAEAAIDKADAICEI